MYNETVIPFQQILDVQFVTVEPVSTNSYAN